MDVLSGAGLGLDYGTLRFSRTTDAWLTAGTALRDPITDLLDGVTVRQARELRTRTRKLLDGRPDRLSTLRRMG